MFRMVEEHLASFVSYSTLSSAFQHIRGATLSAYETPNLLFRVHLMDFPISHLGVYLAATLGIDIQVLPLNPILLHIVDN